MAKRHVEVFTAGCPVCEPTVKLVEELACSNCEVTVYDLNFLGAIAAIEQYGIKSVPAVVVDGRLIACRAGGGYDREQLLAAGIGRPLE